MLHARPELLPTLDHARSNLTNGGFAHVAEVVLLLAGEVVDAIHELAAATVFDQLRKETQLVRPSAVDQAVLELLLRAKEAA